MEGPSHTPEEWARIKTAEATATAKANCDEADPPVDVAPAIPSAASPGEPMTTTVGNPYHPAGTWACLGCLHYDLDAAEEPCEGCVRLQDGDHFVPAKVATEDEDPAEAAPKVRRPVIAVMIMPRPRGEG